MSSKNLFAVNIKALNILVLLYPLALIAGNFLINLDIILICILGTLAYRKSIFNLEQIKSTFLIFFFFILMIIITILNSKILVNEQGFLKSFFYLRYFIFFIVIGHMLKNDHLNIKQLLICCLLITLFISLDSTFQAVTGKNFFGLESFGTHNTSIFGKELVLGSYIQRFFLFALICIPFVFNKLDNKKLSIICLLLIIFFLGTLFSGNRMPLATFFLSLGLTFLLIKELRLTLLVGFLFCSLIFVLTVYNNQKYKDHYWLFFKYSMDTIVNLKNFSGMKYPELDNKKNEVFRDKYVKKKDSATTTKKKSYLHPIINFESYKIVNFGSGHQVVFLTAIDTWTDNLFFGNGLKSFRITCKEKLHLPNRVCQAHPHNYYLELLNDSGLVGTLILIFGIFYLLLKKSSNFKNFNRNERFLFLCILIIICSEFFPIRSSGSFFTTANSSFIFFLLGLINGIKKINQD